MSGSVFTYEPQMMVTEHINKSCKNVGRRETIPLLEYFYPTSSCITFLSCFPSVDPASGERNWRVLHKNPSSGKRSTEPFGKMDSSENVWEARFSKLTLFPEEMQAHISLGRVSTIWS